MKRKYKLFRLHFNAPLHLGNQRDDYTETMETIHSDSMYAAITAALFKVGWSPPHSFQGHLECTISSLFPFYQKDQKPPIYFFPKSKKQETPNEELLDDHKQINEIQWLDHYFFEKYIRGHALQALYADGKVEPSGKNKYQKGRYFTRADISEDFVYRQMLPRVKVSRSGKEEAETFYMERLFFKDHSGMFFLAEGDTSLLEKGLKILEQEGTGTDRNVGNGFFNYQKDTLELELPQKSNYQMNLSLFLPSDSKSLKDNLDNHCAYGLKNRGGWVSTPPFNSLRKNSIYMFEEGSIFKSDNNKPEARGRIVNLKPNPSKLPEELKNIHDIYRSGEAIFIPVKPS